MAITPAAPVPPAAPVSRRLAIRFAAFRGHRVGRGLAFQEPLPVVGRRGYSPCRPDRRVAFAPGVAGHSPSRGSEVFTAKSWDSLTRGNSALTEKKSLAREPLTWSPSFGVPSLRP